MENTIFNPIILTIIVIILGIFFGVKSKDKNIPVTLGIIGTFIGIVFGLNSLDTSNISISIPKLLEGLSTAFYTSIAGAIISLLIPSIINLIEKFNLGKYIWKNKIFEKNSDTEILKNILEELKYINNNNLKNSNIYDEIKEFKNIFSEKQENLINSFQDFSKQMSENNTNALIKAIEQVMRDFNSKINEQLGENFKQLAISIDNLIIWQNEYKENIISQTNFLKESSENLKNSKDLFEITSNEIKNITEISKTLNEKVNTLNNSLEIFKLGINEFDKIAENTKQSNEKILDSINNLKENIIEKSENYIKNILENFEQLTNNFKKFHKETIEELNNEIQNNNKNSSELFLRMQQNIENDFKKFDEMLGEELNKSLSTLGSQLTSLSAKFVSDYGNLAEKLEKLVNLNK